MPEQEVSLALFPLIAGFLGGLGLFLYGLDRLTEALTRIAGDRMRTILARLTTNRVSGALTGAAVTAVVQSSTVTTVVAIGFVSAGVMASVQAISVVLGANIGTTITAQIISFDISTWAFVLVAVGTLGMLSARRERWRFQAQAVFGLGLLFVSMQLMAAAMSPLRDSPGFVDVMERLGAPVLGMLVGAVYSALVRSSSATTALAITMATQDLISLEAGVAIVIGANIGTCVTAVLAAIGRPPAARRVAAAHVTINVLGGLAWIGFTGQLAALGRWMAGGSDDVARQLANAHTVFNVSVALVMLPLLGVLVGWLDRRIPDEPPAEGASMPSALDEGLLGTPSLALSAARIQLGRLCQGLGDRVNAGAETALSGSWSDLNALTRADDEVDRRYREVVEYLTDVGQGSLSERRTDELFLLLSVADDIESLGDVLEINLVTIGQRRLERSIALDAAAMANVRELAEAVTTAVQTLASALLDDEVDLARDVVAMKAGINALLARAFSQQAHRLVASGTSDLESFSIERDALEALRRIYYFAKRASGSLVSGKIADPVRDEA